MAILHKLQRTWYSHGSTLTVKGDLFVRRGFAPTRLIPVERGLNGRKLIAVARALAGEEQIAHPRASNSEQIVWLSQRCEHANARMRA